MTTLFDLSLAVAKEVTQVAEGIADSGTVSTLTDSARKEKNGTYNGGTLWLLSGDRANNALVVEGFAGNTMTVATQASALAAGDQYAVANADFPLWKIRQSINTVLGNVLTTDESLTWLADTYTYTLPTLSGELVGVELVNSAGAASPSRHYKRRGAQLIFDYGFGAQAGDTIRLLIASPHDDLTLSTDTLDAGLPVMTVIWDAVVDVLKWGYRQYRHDAGKMVEEYLQMALQKQARYGKLMNGELPRMRYKSAGWR